MECFMENKMVLKMSSVNEDEDEYARSSCFLVSDGKCSCVSLDNTGAFLVFMGFNENSSIFCFVLLHIMAFQ